MGLLEREKKYPIMLSFSHYTFAMPKHTNFAMPKHTNVISRLAGNNGKMVIYAFLLGFSSPSHQKE